MGVDIAKSSAKAMITASTTHATHARCLFAEFQVQFAREPRLRRLPCLTLQPGEDLLVRLPLVFGRSNFRDFWPRPFGNVNIDDGPSDPRSCIPQATPTVNIDKYFLHVLETNLHVRLPSTRAPALKLWNPPHVRLPEKIRVDNGPEFTGSKLEDWAKDHETKIEFIEPGKPNQNAFIERFNRIYREEVLDLWLLATLDQVRTETWKFLLDYNEDRPHDSLHDLTPSSGTFICRPLNSRTRVRRTTRMSW